MKVVLFAPASFEEFVVFERLQQFGLPAGGKADPIRDLPWTQRPVEQDQQA